MVVAATEEIRKTIVVDAPPEVVFKALTDEEELVQWMPSEAKIDAREGGKFEFKYRWASRGLNATVKGKILEFVPNRRLSYTFDSETAPQHEKRTTGSVVAWILDALPDGRTSVTLVHSGVAKEFSVDADTGWSYFMGRLANYVGKSPAHPS
jgi:uncharacterized protein YndB with AHSA1/START domain